ncbi:MAG: RluA family pseudouridine synthase [Deltaproteobacteria bacterium]|nr:RluA family pseudouridine synthase [Deltaproteobacteria bacterium]
MQKIRVDSKFNGIRLDVFVAEQLSERSRSLSEYLIENGYVKVNGFIVKKGYQLKIDDTVEFYFNENELLSILPDDSVKFDVLLKKDDYIIVLKPEGLKTHPLVPFEKGTLLNGIVSKFPSAGELYAKRYEGGLLHRLDNDTSGLVLCALNQRSFKRLKNIFKAGRIKKYYYAVVNGVIKKGGAISAKIISPFKGSYKVFVDPTTEDPEYVTFFEPIKASKKYTLLDIELVGGKMHQIRAHLSWLGFPIVGDKLYNRDKSFKGRMMLHSYRLTCPGEFDVKTDLPEEFKKLLE